MRSSSISINLRFFSSPALFFDYESRGRLKTELKVIFKISSDYEYGPTSNKNERNYQKRR